MNKEKWNPDHSTSKGYPFDAISTREKFPNRITVVQDEKNCKTGILYNPEHYPGYKGITWLQRLFAGSTIDFLLHRLFDSGKALNEAEQQIADILVEHPFIPEDFQFKIVAGPKTIKESPTKIYQSTLDPSFSIFRGDGYNWKLLEKLGAAEFRETNLYLPCHRIAYAAFVALSVEVDAEIKPREELLLELEKPIEDKASLSE